MFWKTKFFVPYDIGPLMNSPCLVYVFISNSDEKKFRSHNLISANTVTHIMFIAGHHPLYLGYRLSLESN